MKDMKEKEINQLKKAKNTASNSQQEQIVRLEQALKSAKSTIKQLSDTQRKNSNKQVQNLKIDSMDGTLDEVEHTGAPTTTTTTTTTPIIGPSFPPSTVKNKGTVLGRKYSVKSFTPNNSHLSLPFQGISVSVDGTVLVVDSSGISTISDDKCTKFAQKTFRGATIDNYGYVIAANASNNMIEKYDKSKRVISCFGTKGKVNTPVDIKVAPSDDIVMTDNCGLKIIDPSGNLKAIVNPFDGLNDEKWDPTCLDIDRTTGNIIVSDKYLQKVHILTKQGNLIKTVGNIAENRPFDHPIGVAVDGQGNIVVADNGNDRIHIFDKDGKLNSYFDCEKPQYLVVDCEGNILITTSTKNVVHIAKP